VTYPGWWGENVRVVSEGGQPGTIVRYPGSAWAVRLDGEEQKFIINPVPSLWALEVKTGLTRGQFDAIVYDAERALLRRFGLHYVPAFEELPEIARVGKQPRPKVVGREDLDGIRNVVRGAVADALAQYVVE
jgi:hypothetical protein